MEKDDDANEKRCVRVEVHLTRSQAARLDDKCREKQLSRSSVLAHEAGLISTTNLNRRSRNRK